LSGNVYLPDEALEATEETAALEEVAVVEVVAAAEVVEAAAAEVREFPTRVVDTWEAVAETVLATEAELTLEEAAPLERDEKEGKRRVSEQGVADSSSAPSFNSFLSR
jgi:hypothetical protein